MAYPTTSNNLVHSHTSGQIVASADINAIEVDADQLTLKVGSGSSTPTAGTVLTGNGTGTSIWQGITLATATAKTTTYVMTSADGLIEGDATSGGFTITLPDITTVRGRVFFIQKIDSTASVVTVAAAAAQSVAAQSPLLLVTQWDSAILVSPNSGTIWRIF